MTRFWSALYALALSLWVGGITLFTFIVTPIIFRSFGRDLAGSIVGDIFPAYFLYNLVVAAAALVLFLLMHLKGRALASWISLALLAAAVVLNVLIVFKLHPDAVRAKSEVTSFERESADSPARRKFAKLHGISASLNLALLADGIALLVIHAAAKRNEGLQQRK